MERTQSIDFAEKGQTPDRVEVVSFSRLAARESRQCLVADLVLRVSDTRSPDPANRQCKVADLSRRFSDTDQSLQGTLVFVKPSTLSALLQIR
jgi:hypothetical protein